MLSWPSNVQVAFTDFDVKACFNVVYAKVSIEVTMDTCDFGNYYYR